jgi:hypothetical protein
MGIGGFIWEYFMQKFHIVFRKTVFGRKDLKGLYFIGG